MKSPKISKSVNSMSSLEKMKTKTKQKKCKDFEYIKFPENRSPKSRSSPKMYGQDLTSLDSGLYSMDEFNQYGNCTCSDSSSSINSDKTLTARSVQQQKVQKTQTSKKKTISKQPIHINPPEREELEKLSVNSFQIEKSAAYNQTLISKHSGMARRFPVSATNSLTTVSYKRKNKVLPETEIVDALTEDQIMLPVLQKMSRKKRNQLLQMHVCNFVRNDRR